MNCRSGWRWENAASRLNRMHQVAFSAAQIWRIVVCPVKACKKFDRLPVHARIVNEKLAGVKP